MRGGEEVEFTERGGWEGVVGSGSGGREGETAGVRLGRG